MASSSTGFNSGLDIGKSYYVATANPAPDYPALQGEVDADLVVVGGGCTGLSAALHAAERGLKVVLLEGGKIGWGASGRNGGQMIPGLRKGAKGLVKLYGPERAKVLFDLAFEARGLVLDIIERHAIDCDLRLAGHLVGAVNGSDLRDLEEEAECLATAMKFPHAEILSAAQARGKVEQHLRPLRPVKLDQALRALAQAGDHLAAIAPRCTPADLAAFEQHYLQATLGGVKGRRQAGTAAADHHQIGLDISHQRRMVRRRIGGGDIIGFADIETGIETR